MKSSDTDRLAPRNSKGGRPTREVAARLGDHILDVALEEFIRAGAESASMECIALAAKVSKRTLYARYGSRTGLLGAAVKRGVQTYVQAVSAGLPAGDIRKRLRYFARRSLDSSLEAEVVGLERLVVWIADHEPELHDQLYQHTFYAPVSLLHAVLEEAMQRSEVKDCSLETAIFVYDALVSHPRRRILLRLGLENKKAVKQAYQDKALDIVLLGIGSPG
ncbi:TetR/AcrR family transcriptional regulator [Sphingomonas oryzagri]